jgi:hypothetical protein
MMEEAVRNHAGLELLILYNTRARDDEVEGSKMEHEGFKVQERVIELKVIR